MCVCESYLLFAINLESCGWCQRLESSSCFTQTVYRCSNKWMAAPKNHIFPYLYLDVFCSSKCWTWKSEAKIKFSEKAQLTLTCPWTPVTFNLLHVHICLPRIIDWTINNDRFSNCVLFSRISAQINCSHIPGNHFLFMKEYFILLIEKSMENRRNMSQNLN